MKNKITAIIIALSIGTLMSCNSGTTGTETQNATDTTVKTDAQPAPETKGEEDETHELNKWGAGAHKGIVVEAGEKNHIEMTVSGKDVNFYPCDDRTEPIDAKGWKGKAVFQYKDGSSETVDLMLMDGALTAMGSNSGKSFTVVATLTMNDVSITSQFSSEGSMEK